MINNKTIPYFLIVFQTVLCSILPLYSQPDLSIVGYVITEGGIGKIPITILETLDSDISANIIPTNTPSIKESLSDRATAALNDKTPGKIAIFTELLAYCSRNPTTYIPQESVIKIAYSMLETDRIHAEWVEILNDKFDAVIVPDQYLVTVYENSGVNIPIFSLPIPMILTPYYHHPLHSRYPFTPFVFEEKLKHRHPASFLKTIVKLFRKSSSRNFNLTKPFYSKYGPKLFVFGDTSANKNPEVLVTAFARAFGNHPDVQLVMRAVNLFPETKNIVNRLVEQFHLKNVKLEEGPLFLDQYIDKLASLDCYVNLSRGEGFSLIQREALALGIPVMTTNNTALSTICNSGCVREVSSDLLGPPNSIYQTIFGTQDVGHQFDCTVEDAVVAFLDMYENYGKYIDKARQGRDWVRQYDSTNKELRKSYRTLIKPTKVIFGDKNELCDGILITNSLELYQKYQQLNQGNQINQEQSNESSLSTLLTQSLKDDSHHEHNAFNLAQSYRKLKQFDQAIHWYKICAQKGNQKDEIWYSKLSIGEILEEMGLWNQALESYLDAYQYNPNRAEPLQKIASYYRLHGQNDLAYLFAKQGSLIPYPQTPALFLSPSVYTYQFDEEISIVAYYTPYKEEGFKANNRLILKKGIPKYIKNQALRNSLFYVDNIKANEFKVIDNEVKKNAKIKPLIKYDSCYDLSHFKKPIPPIEFEGGYLLIVNEVICRSKQRYDLHRFLSLDKDFNVKQISKPFIFLQKGAEQCCRMTLDHAEKTCKIVVNSKDQQTYLLSIDFDTIHSLLDFIPAENKLNQTYSPSKYLEGRIPVNNARYATLKLALELMNERKPITIIETGTSRYGSSNFIGDGGFTIICGDWAKDHQAMLYSVDISSEAVERSKAAIGTNPYATIFCQDSVEFLRTFPLNIDVLYLDSYDFDYQNPYPSQEHHLKEIQAAYSKLTPNSIIIIDDCQLPHGGKGALVIPYLQNLGWKVIANEYQVILVKG